MSLSITYSNGLEVDYSKPVNYWVLLKLYEDYGKNITDEQKLQVEKELIRLGGEERERIFRLFRH
jgi:hypothetical protein